MLMQDLNLPQEPVARSTGAASTEAQPPHRSIPVVEDFSLSLMTRVPEAIAIFLRHLVECRCLIIASSMPHEGNDEHAGSDLHMAYNC